MPLRTRCCQSRLRPSFQSETSRVLLKAAGSVEAAEWISCLWSCETIRTKLLRGAITGLLHRGQPALLQLSEHNQPWGGGGKHSLVPVDVRLQQVQKTTLMLLILRKQKQNLCENAATHKNIRQTNPDVSTRLGVPKGSKRQEEEEQDEDERT